MPELPEVERARRLTARVAVGRTVRDAWCADDPIVFHRVSPERVRAAVVGRRVEGAARRGKYVWLELDQRPWPVLHLGMTGGLRCPEAPALPLVSSPTEPESMWPPRFAKLRLWFDDGGELVLTNARRFGRIRLCRDPLSEPPIARLGFDPLLDPPSAEELGPLLARRRGTLKGLLLDQSFAAGVGNWIADEVLYQARLAPDRRPDSLRDDEVRVLTRALGEVVSTAVAVDADASRFPEAWLFHRRWRRRGGPTETTRGEGIEWCTVAGRTTAWVPEVQQ